MCRTACKTQDHQNWGECFRAAGVQYKDPLQVAKTRRWDGELQEYRDARRQGVSPKTTKRKDIRAAMREAERNAG